LNTEASIFEEPGAVIPHAGICAGVAGNMDDTVPLQDYRDTPKEYCKKVLCLLLVLTFSPGDIKNINLLIDNVTMFCYSIHITKHCYVNLRKG
jgi:hypothetical protein